MKSYQVQACKIKEHDGVFSLDLSPSARKSIQAILEYAHKNKGGFIGFRLFFPKTRRSTGEKSQNHHLNGHVQTICAERGLGFDEVKGYIKHRAIDMGYPIVEDENGVPMRHPFYGHILGMSEADASIRECGLLIDAAHLVAAELSVQLIEPEDD